VADKRLVLASAIAVGLHVALGWLAWRAPAPERVTSEPSAKKMVVVRAVTRPKPKPSEPRAPAPPLPEPKAPEFPNLKPMVRTPTPQSVEPAKPVEVTAAAKDQPERPSRKRKRTRKPRRKRGPGRTLTSKSGRAAPAATPSGGGRVLDMGEWDASAGPGDSRSTEREEPAAPSTSPTPGNGNGNGPAATNQKRRGKLMPPKPLSRPAGKYPAGSARAAGPVDVVLTLRVTAIGRVGSVKVVRSGGPALDKEARRVVRGVRFEPATRGGEPVPMTIPWTVTFR
jgi:protein TonB